MNVLLSPWGCVINASHLLYIATGCSVCQTCHCFGSNEDGAMCKCYKNIDIDIYSILYTARLKLPKISMRSFLSMRITTSMWNNMDLFFHPDTLLKNVFCANSPNQMIRLNSPLDAIKDNLNTWAYSAICLNSFSLWFNPTRIGDRNMYYDDKSLSWPMITKTNKLYNIWM